MSGELCVHDLPPSWCGNCRERSADQLYEVVSGVIVPDFPAITEYAAAGEVKGTGPLFSSRYDGRCRGCGNRWHEGDFIAWSGDEDGYVCADCAGGG